LKGGRRNPIKFDWDEVLSFEGESGPYMLYQYVRMGSVLQKYAERYGVPGSGSTSEDTGLEGDPALLALDEEWRIARLLAEFPDAVRKAGTECEPSVVARHLMELAASTSTWWSATKDTRIVGDDAALSAARARLVSAIRKVLGRGLTLLGLTPVERM
jgi:arginyl-tRNA synthetase